MTRSERIYRRLLRIYPRSFRAEYEEEMTRLFLDQLDDAGRTGRSIERSSVWLHSLTDIASNAAAEHLRRENSVAKRVDPGSAALAVSPERTGPMRLGYALASLPFIVILATPIIAPGFFEPVSSNPPEILGLPAGIVILFLVATWASMAFLAIRMARSGVGIALALLVFTVPSIVAIVALPSMILAMLSSNV